MKAMVMPRPFWSTLPAVVIASGPSLADQQLQVVHAARERSACNVITVNNAAERAPWAHAHYAGDYLWFKTYLPKLRPLCRGEWWTQDQASAERWKLHRALGANKPGLGAERVHLNGNSGAQAVNLAALWGARRILLLGFDMKPATDGRLHYFGAHPKPLVQVCLFEEWLHKWKQIAADAEARGIEIVNATPGSALTCVQAVELDRWLQ